MKLKIFKTVFIVFVCLSAVILIVSGLRDFFQPRILEPSQEVEKVATYRPVKVAGMKLLCANCPDSVTSSTDTVFHKIEKNYFDSLLVQSQYKLDSALSVRASKILDADPVKVFSVRWVLACQTFGSLGLDPVLYLHRVPAFKVPKKIKPLLAEHLTFGDFKKTSGKEYVSKYAKLAKQEESRTGVPAAVTLAQGLHESNAGNSALALVANNHFGIKCFSTKCSKGHCTNFSDDSHKDFFMVFSSPESSFYFHSNFLRKQRYQPCFKEKSLKGWCDCLQRQGYATDKAYSKKLYKTIRRYDLDKL